MQAVLGLVAGLLEFVPFVGPLITAVILAAIGFLSGYEHKLLFLGFVGVWSIIQDYINLPLKLGRGLELQRLLSIVAILARGAVAESLECPIRSSRCGIADALAKNWELRTSMQDTARSTVRKTMSELRTEPLNRRLSSVRYDYPKTLSSMW